MQFMILQSGREAGPGVIPGTKVSAGVLSSLDFEKQRSTQDTLSNWS